MNSGRLYFFYFQSMMVQNNDIMVEVYNVDPSGSSEMVKVSYVAFCTIFTVHVPNFSTLIIPLGPVVQS